MTYNYQSQSPTDNWRVIRTFPWKRPKTRRWKRTLFTVKHKFHLNSPVSNGVSLCGTCMVLTIDRSRLIVDREKDCSCSLQVTPCMASVGVFTLATTDIDGSSVKLNAKNGYYVSRLIRYRMKSVECPSVRACKRSGTECFAVPR